MSTLEIQDLHVSIAVDGGTKEILTGVNLTVRAGETHAIMGPNGSGKSTLAYAVAGHPRYEVTSGSIRLDGADVLEMTVDERARAGLFLAMQYPVEVPGVSTANFLRSAATAVRGEAPKLRTWVKEVKQAMTDLEIDPEFAERNVNEGFSGGEKKRQEVLQLSLLKPKFAVLDETDSGLDVDALRIVSEGVNRFKAGGEKKRHEILQLELLKPKVAVLDETDSGLDVDALRIVSEGVNRVRATGEVGVLLITHYTRILRYIRPDFVHVFIDGRFVEEGGPELAEQLEAEGYDRFTGTAAPAASPAGA